jgi:hypothetical protein
VSGEGPVEPRWVLRGISGKPWATLSVSGGAVRFDYRSWGADARVSLALADVRGIELRRVHDPMLLVAALVSFVWAMWDLAHRPVPNPHPSDLLAAAREIHEYTAFFAAKIGGVVGFVTAYLWRRGVRAIISGDCLPVVSDDPLRALKLLGALWFPPLLLLLRSDRGATASGVGNKISVKVPGGLEDLADGRDFLEAVEVLSLRARIATRSRARAAIARASNALATARLPGLLDAARSPLRNSHLVAILVGAITAFFGVVVVAIAAPRTPREAGETPVAAREAPAPAPDQIPTPTIELPHPEPTRPAPEPAQPSPEAQSGMDQAAEQDAPSVPPSFVTASSVFRHGRQVFSPELAFDGDRRTAWNEGAAGNGVGEWIEAHFASEVLVRSVTVVTGWDAVSRHGHDLFVENAHIRRATLLLDGREVATVMADSAARELTFETVTPRATTVRVRIDDVWPGTRYEDLCVSEVTIDARSVARPAAGVAPTNVAPTGTQCDAQMPTDSNFHLRPTDSTSRAGSVEVAAGTRVAVLRVGASWRNNNAARSYLVRIAEGDFVGREGFVFLHPSDFAGRPECPQ